MGSTQSKPTESEHTSGEHTSGEHASGEHTSGDHKGNGNRRTENENKFVVKNKQNLSHNLNHNLNQKPNHNLVNSNNTTNSNKNVPVVYIGDSPGIYVSAIYMLTANHPPVIIRKDCGLKYQCTCVPGLPGVNKEEYLEKCYLQAKNMGIKIIEGKNVKIRKEGGLFYVGTESEGEEKESVEREKEKESVEREKTESEGEEETETERKEKEKESDNSEGKEETEGKEKEESDMGNDNPSFVTKHLIVDKLINKEWEGKGIHVIEEGMNFEERPDFNEAIVIGGIGCELAFKVKNKL